MTRRGRYTPYGVGGLPSSLSIPWTSSPESQETVHVARIARTRTRTRTQSDRTCGGMIDSDVGRSGARERTRTSTPLRAPDPKSGASANFATRAGCGTSGRAAPESVLLATIPDRKRSHATAGSTAVHDPPSCPATEIEMLRLTSLVSNTEIEGRCRRGVFSRASIVYRRCSPWSAPHAHSRTSGSRPNAVFDASDLGAHRHPGDR